MSTAYLIFDFVFLFLFLCFILLFSPFGTGLEEDKFFVSRKKVMRSKENQVSAVFWAPTFGTHTQRMVNWDSEAGCPPEQWFSRSGCLYVGLLWISSTGVRACIVLHGDDVPTSPVNNPPGTESGAIVSS